MPVMKVVGNEMFMPSVRRIMSSKFVTVESGDTHWVDTKKRFQISTQ